MTQQLTLQDAEQLHAISTHLDDNVNELTL